MRELLRYLSSREGSSNVIMVMYAYHCKNYSKRIRIREGKVQS